MAAGISAANLSTIFRVTSGLLGCIMTATTARALISPNDFAKDFGLPIEVSEHNEKTSQQSRSQSKHPEPWVIPVAGRNLSLGLATLTFAYLGEEKITAIVLICAAAGACMADTLATFQHGKKSAVNHHVGATFVLGGLGIGRLVTM